MKEKKLKKKTYMWYLIMTVLLIVITLTVGVSVFSYYINHFTKEQDVNQYDKYYVMIAGDDSSLWQSVYEGAYDAGLQENSYVDLLDGVFDKSYSKEDLMRIAIASEVDGIIVAADESDEMTELINEAVEKGIPVVTLYGDNTHSARCSFVGIGSYDLGREYGRQVLEIVENTTIQAEAEAAEEPIEETTAAEPVKVMVLVNANAMDSAQNILCSGIQDTIEREKLEGMQFEMSLVPIDDENAFSVEESIRDIFREDELPDIIICLNELNTTCVYQAVVDYNKVGQVNILGYYDSDTIMKAIDRNVIYATISIDANQMGRFCVEALTEYNTYGNTSQYFTADITLINKKNVTLYMEGEQTDEE